MTVKWLWQAGATARRSRPCSCATADRATVCVSSQAGCAMGCTFCATGQAGLRAPPRRRRDRRAGRPRAARTRRSGSRNVVFMGMGEPLANVDPVLDVARAAARRRRALGAPPHRVDRRRRARHAPPRGLPAPGHARGLAARARRRAPRAELVPLNRRYPIAEVLDAAREYAASKGRRVTFEYACIAGRERPPAPGRLARRPAHRASAAART